MVRINIRPVEEVIKAILVCGRFIGEAFDKKAIFVGKKHDVDVDVDVDDVGGVDKVTEKNTAGS